MSNKAVFLDRDDTLIADSGYINDPAGVHLLPGTCEALVSLRNMGFMLIVVSNQSGVARGYFTEQTLDLIHKRLESLLDAGHVKLDRIYYCPYLAEAKIEAYRKDSSWRKPKPGMLLAAAKELDIDLEASWMIGDSLRDVEAGKAAGCRTILLDNAETAKRLTRAKPTPDFRVANIPEAANIISQHP